MANFKITATTTVAELKEQFRGEFGGILRVYQGRSEAPEDATLVSLGGKVGELECRASRTVGKFIEAFQSELGLKVKVYTKDNWVSVLDGITLATVREIPKNARKAQMEQYLAYKREEEDSVTQTKMREIKIYLYGEGRRLDVFDSDGDFQECYNAMRDEEYFEIKVQDGEKETEYSYTDFGSQIRGYEWPEEVYDGERFIDSNYVQFEGKDPSEVFEFGGCDLCEAEEEGVGRIDLIQTKIPATVTIELNVDEEFDPKKVHFMYSEFVTPDEELEINPGVVYNGKQYDIELDVESEREISVDTIWEA